MQTGTIWHPGDQCPKLPFRFSQCPFDITSFLLLRLSSMQTFLQCAAAAFLQCAATADAAAADVSPQQTNHRSAASFNDELKYH